MRTEEYIYPVEEIDSESLLVMHQKSLHEIDLLSWDINKKEAQKVLWSIYMPSSVSLLPSKSGFSFIDQGRLRIKHFNKRSPKAVNIYEPITTLDSVTWIDDETFYFTAEDPYFHNVFVCELHKNIASLSRLTFQEESDFLYPQKVDDSLFVIKRSPKKQFSIVKLPWLERSFENYKPIKEEVVFKGEKSYCFLKMINKAKGYFISYNPCKESDDNLYTFWCNEITLVDGGWKHEELFSFKIHEKYIMGKSDSRMYESIKPLLPSYQECGIFFSHFDGCKQCCTLKKYNNRTKSIQNVPASHRKSVSLFTPLICGDSAYCGMMINRTRSGQNSLELQFDIPEIKAT